MRIGSSRRSLIEPGLPLPYPALERAGVRVRRGQTSLTVAAPGVGKSQLWLNLCQRMRRHDPVTDRWTGIPVLYWSADTDQADVTIRTFALHLGLATTDVEQKLLDPTWRDWMFEKLAGRGEHIEWVFDSPITAKGLGERMNAFAEVRGEYPWVTVLDNMSNAIQNPADEYAEIKQLQNATQILAREANTHVAILHHAKGEYDSGNKPIPQSGALQNAFKIPELGLTLCRPDEDSSMNVFVVKNRGGKSDPAAKYPVNLPVDFSRATVSGYREIQREGTA